MAAATESREEKLGSNAPDRIGPRSGEGKIRRTKDSVDIIEWRAADAVRFG